MEYFEYSLCILDYKYYEHSETKVGPRMVAIGRFEDTMYKVFVTPSLDIIIKYRLNTAGDRRLVIPFQSSTAGHRKNTHLCILEAD